MVPRHQLNAGAASTTCSAAPLGLQAALTRILRYRRGFAGSWPPCTRERSNTPCSCVPPVADDRWLSTELEQGLTIQARRRELLQVAADSGSCVMVVKRGGRSDSDAGAAATASKPLLHDATVGIQPSGAASATVQLDRSGAKRQRTAQHSIHSTAQSFNNDRESNRKHDIKSTTDERDRVGNQAPVCSTTHGSQETTHKSCGPARATPAAAHNPPIAAGRYQQDGSLHQEGYYHLHQSQRIIPAFDDSAPGISESRQDRSRHLYHDGDSIHALMSRDNITTTPSLGLQAQLAPVSGMIRSGSTIASDDFHPPASAYVSVLAQGWEEAEATVEAPSAQLVGATVGVAAWGVEAYVGEEPCSRAANMPMKAVVSATVSNGRHAQHTSVMPMSQNVGEQHVAGGDGCAESASDGSHEDMRGNGHTTHRNGNGLRNGGVRHKEQDVGPSQQATARHDAVVAAYEEDVDGSQRQNSRVTGAQSATDSPVHDRTASNQECSSSTCAQPDYPRVVRVSRNTRAGSLGGCVAKLIRSEGAADVLVMGRPALKVAMYGLAIARSMLQEDGNGRDCQLHCSWLQVRGNQLSKRRLVLHVSAAAASMSPHTSHTDAPSRVPIISEPFGPDNSASANRLAKSMVKLVLRRERVTYKAWSYDGLYKVLVAMAAAHSILHLHSQGRFNLCGFPQLQSRTCGQQQRSLFHLTVQLSEAPSGFHPTAHADGWGSAVKGRENHLSAGATNVDHVQWPPSSGSDFAVSTQPSLGTSNRSRVRLLAQNSLLRQSSLLSKMGQGFSAYGHDGVGCSLYPDHDRFRHEVDHWDGGEVAERAEREQLYYEGLERHVADGEREQRQGKEHWVAEQGSSKISTRASSIMVTSSTLAPGMRVHTPAMSTVASEHNLDDRVGMLSAHVDNVHIGAAPSLSPRPPPTTCQRPAGGQTAWGADDDSQGSVQKRIAGMFYGRVVSHPLDFHEGHSDEMPTISAVRSQQVSVPVGGGLGEDARPVDDHVHRAPPGCLLPSQSISDDTGFAGSPVQHAGPTGMSSAQGSVPGCKQRVLGVSPPSKLVSADFFSFDPKLDSAVKADEVLAVFGGSASQPVRKTKKARRRQRQIMAASAEQP